MCFLFWWGSVRIGIFRRGDIFYIFIGVVYLFSVSFAVAIFCISLGRFPVWFVFWFWLVQEGGYLLQF